MFNRTAARAIRGTTLFRNSRQVGLVRRYSVVKDERSSSSLPLAGYRVLDMTRVLAGPYCTQILGDLGAEVIKIEHPTRGDDTRAWGPPYAAYRDGSHLEGPGESAYFLGVNRNKKSVGLSFQHAEGVDILHKLAEKCDILVENYLPGTLKKYGMDFDTLHKINPGLIYASITGYGQSGPFSQRAGYDVMVEAEFGLMHITGDRDGPPVKVGVAVTDLTTGLYTSNSIMAALLSRAKTGRGQHIDVALSDCQTATLANIASSCLISGKKDSGRWGTAHPSIVPYKSFKTKDGDVLFGGGNDRLFGILCDGLGRPEWKTDPKYSINSQRVANRVELEDEIEKISVQKTTQEWLYIFEGKGMPYAAVNDVQGALNHEHTKARNMVVEINHEQCGPIKLVNTPVKYSESNPSVRTAPPTLGQHTDEILSDILGLGADEVAALKEKGAVRRFSRCKEGDTPATPVEATAPPQPAQEAPTTKAASPAPSTASSTGRPPYVPQFSAATQMILKRISSKPGSLSSALSSASSTMAKASIEKSTYEDAKRRLVMNMNTSLTMSMPMPTPKQSHSSSTKQKSSSSATTMRMPMNDAFQLRTPAPAKNQTSAVAKSSSAPSAQAPKTSAPKSKSKAYRGTKRKRGKDNDDEDATSSLSELSESEGSGTVAAQESQSVLTMTKSGRQVQKPSQYNPSAQSARDAAAQKRKSYGKRTPEQQLCKLCTRSASVPANQIVFCDGCNCCWHQMCHDPYIDDDFVSNESRPWFCRGCSAKRERYLARKKSLDGFKGVSWSTKSSDQKRKYLSGVPHTQLVNILMYITEIHPDLPIFPAHETRRTNAQEGRPSSYDNARVKTDSNINVGPTHFSSKVSTPDSHSTTTLKPKGSAADSQNQAARESSEDSVPPAWPKVGHGCMEGIKVDEDDLRDDNDYEAFSVTSYDAKGRKIMENGMPV
ncbi:CoA-transferase family III domain-containing protein [Rostrohypoxylon terebratum]|nr:CoA-transferase family III domain-containing protein [Rostrohypoxylon terebratum]